MRRKNQGKSIKETSPTQNEKPDRDQLHAITRIFASKYTSHVKHHPSTIVQARLTFKPGSMSVSEASRIKGQTCGIGGTGLKRRTLAHII